MIISKAEVEFREKCMQIQTSHASHLTFIFLIRAVLCINESTRRAFEFSRAATVYGKWHVWREKAGAIYLPQCKTSIFLKSRELANID